MHTYIRALIIDLIKWIHAHISHNELIKFIYESHHSRHQSSFTPNSSNQTLHLHTNFYIQPSTSPPSTLSYLALNLPPGEHPFHHLRFPYHCLTPSPPYPLSHPLSKPTTRWAPILPPTFSLSLPHPYIPPTSPPSPLSHPRSKPTTRWAPIPFATATPFVKHWERTTVHFCQAVTRRYVIY